MIFALLLMLISMTACASQTVGTVILANQSLQNNQSSARIGNLTVDDNIYVENVTSSALVSAVNVNASAKIEARGVVISPIGVIMNVTADNVTATQNVRAANVTATRALEADYAILVDNTGLGYSNIGAIWVYINNSGIQNLSGLCFRNTTATITLNGVCTG